jgi:hypothetical protein
VAEPLIPTTIVAGSTAQAREDWIGQDLDAAGKPAAALLLEGLPTGSSPLDEMSQLTIRRTSPGCLCCAGNLVMKVTLDRLLRARPPRLYLGVAPGTHLQALATMLTAPPYSDWLQLKETVSV